MKPTYLLQFLILFSTSLVYAQNDSLKTHGLFYKISLAATLKINEDYNSSCGCDEGETFLEPSALFVNNTVGYQFDDRSSIGLNFEWDWHTEQGLHFLPVYLSFQYNIISLDERDNIFVRGGYGTLLGISKDFEKGNMYKFGLGVMFLEQDTNPSYLMGLDFTRKRFGYKTLEGISSVSIFLEVKFL
jgi:hypothetical protein